MHFCREPMSSANEPCAESSLYINEKWFRNKAERVMNKELRQ